MAIRRTPTTVNHGPTIDGDDYSVAVNTEVEALWDRAPQWVDAVTGTNALVGTTTPEPDDHAKGQRWVVIPDNTNTGPATLAIGAMPLISIKAADGSALVGGELVADSAIELLNDGTNLRLLRSHVSVVAGAHAIFAYTKTAGTNSDTFTSGARRTLPLNATVLNNISGAALNVAGPDINKFTLPAGTYEVHAFCAVNSGTFLRLFLRDETGAADIPEVIGLTVGAGNNLPAPLIGRFVLASSSLLSLQYRIKSNSTIGANSNMGETEVYAMVQFKKIG